MEASYKEKAGHIAMFGGNDLAQRTFNSMQHKMLKKTQV